MKELEQILQLWSELESLGESAVLATVVKTHGSSYRLPGARLLLTADGRRVGTVSGGCLEADLVKKAWWLTEKGPLVRRYDTTPDGEIAAEFGLGCNGIIHVLLDRVRPGKADVLELIREVRVRRSAAVVAHILEPGSRVGQRLALGVDGSVTSSVGAPELTSLIEREARSALSERSSRTVRLNSAEVFVETLVPPIRLLIFGAGDDAVPLANLAKYLGWHIAVLDGRAHYARRERFPLADEVLVCPAGESGIAVDPWTVAVVMSHSYSQDLAVVRELSGKPLRYLGILGPRKRTTQLLEEAGIPATDRMPALHSPMGLDIGADGPEQVALAVTAEIQATLNGREGGLLHRRSGSIHAPDDATDAEALWMQSIACA
jgi:xanthine/CO dehydrogenase XdhC/CoxF family maturation factor